ncbi:hypothetical protein CC1G_10237 [Coprinopsis cinerea okayama7|uniref:DUF6570 domain-containing protein n=1 Tax=Coprinopsis cinerea (strain Okayama-7 / 130 / ATCC MYA-4618 / FGSC 9003) TaxID=240176 RepID=A8NPD1_COPC7|nr:hypothetical protein CC1G_10237 [Coprinopsis cinerea okayama7\|eukprot:XP_001835310.2 hypothetical protein CC1G_10237 [Coprinopsis cinerea okayama7\
MKGNVIVAPLDVIELNAVLPPPPEVIRDSLCVIFTGSDQVPSKETIEKYHPVLVRKSRVKTLLEFLLNWNPHYKQVDGFKGYSSEYLNGLFGGETDQGLPQAVEVTYLKANVEMENATSGYTQDTIHDSDVDTSDELSSLLMENVGYTISDNTPVAYEEMKRRTVERCLAGKAFINIS